MKTRIFISLFVIFLFGIFNIAQGQWAVTGSPNYVVTAYPVDIFPYNPTPPTVLQRKTFELKIKYDNLDTTDGISGYFELSHFEYNASGNEEDGFFFRSRIINNSIVTSAHLYGGQTSGPGDFVISSQPYFDTLWHHIAAVQDGNQFHFYFDGINTGTTILSTTPYPGF